MVGIVELRIRLVGAAEERPPVLPQTQPVGVVDDMPGLVAQNAHAPVVLAALDFQHLRLLEPLEPRVRHVERHRHGRGAVGGEPFVRDIEMNREPQFPRSSSSDRNCASRPSMTVPSSFKGRSASRRSSSCSSGSSGQLAGTLARAIQGP